MNWWLLFISLNLLAMVGTAMIVPKAHQDQYLSCEKDVTCYFGGFLFHAVWAVAAIQDFSTPSRSFPDWTRLMGAGMFTCGHSLVIWARRVNPFFTVGIAIPDYLVTTGPYRFLRHPGFIGLSFVASGSFFLLGQWWAVTPLIAYQCVLAYRAYLEGQILSANFPK